MGTKRHWLLVPGLIGAIFSGCDAELKAPSAEFYAKQFVTPRTRISRATIAFYPSGEEMVSNGDLHAHHRIKRPDGAEIDVWVLRGAGERRGVTCVLVHGLMGTKAQWLGLGRQLAARGFDVVLPDLRCHGRSTGKYITYGVREHRDIKAVMDKLIGDGAVAKRVSVFGVSMGATISILYAAKDRRCESVMVVAPFVSAKEILRSKMLFTEDEKIDAIVAAAGRITGCNMAQSSALQAVKGLQRPLLMVHGTLDMVVPYEHGRWIYDAAPGPKEFRTLRFSGHTTSMVFRDEEFTESLIRLNTRGLAAK